MLDLAQYTLGELIKLDTQLQLEIWKRFSLPILLVILGIFAVALIMNKRG